MNHLRNQEKLKQTDEQFEKWLSDRASLKRRQLGVARQQSGPYEIPVVVHVIHNGEAVGSGVNISDEQILSQIDVVNRDFNRLNNDAVNTPVAFQPVAGNMDIQFVLARSDPYGLPTTGIVRVQGTQSTWSIGEEEEFKALSYWPAEDYLNIWVINFSGFLGYAQFPVSSTIPGLEDYQDGLATTDGVVIDYTVFGSSDFGSFNLDPDYDKGRTLTHELGHFFGLRHIWGDDGISCSGTDYINDTPNQAEDTAGCPSSEVTDNCSTVSPGIMYQNYLDYTDDACMNLFTQDQVTRMELVVDDIEIPRRNSLLSSPGLLPPTCDDLDAQIESVISPGAVTCSTNPHILIQIKNLSCDPITSLKVVYAINGGPALTTILTSLNLAPLTADTLDAGSVNFNPDVNTLDVIITEVNGQPDGDMNNSSISTSIRVDNSRDYIPLRENFDQLTWPVINPSDGTVWELNPNTNFMPSAVFRAFDAPDSLNESWLATPVLDFSSASKASMFFDLSYAWNSEDNDQLEILASTDCGTTYQPLQPAFNKSGSELSANNTSSSSWEPEIESDWQLDQFINLSSYAGEENVRFAFVFTNHNGNNIYLDNIEFFISDNPDPPDLGNMPYSIYWYNNFDPAITFNLTERSPVRVQAMDLLGRRYFDIELTDILNQTFPIELQGADGIYLIRVQIDSKFYLSKIFMAR